MLGTSALPDGVLLRPLTLDDAPVLLQAYVRNREHLQRFDPVRPDSFWTLEAQHKRLDSMRHEQAAGRVLACAMFRQDRVLGCATLNTIVFGALCSASLGYWVDVAETGRGLATAAVAALAQIADLELGLHRLEASANPENLSSQRVLTKSGFQQFGTSHRHLHINGKWQDSYLYERVLNDRPPNSPGVVP